MRRKNRRGLLKSYYGDKEEENQGKVRIDPLDVGMLTRVSSLPPSFPFLLLARLVQSWCDVLSGGDGASREGTCTPCAADGPDFDPEMYLKKTLIESNIKTLIEKDSLFTNGKSHRCHQFACDDVLFDCALGGDACCRCVNLW